MDFPLVLHHVSLFNGQEPAFDHLNDELLRFDESQIRKALGGFAACFPVIDCQLTSSSASQSDCRAFSVAQANSSQLDENLY